LTDDGSLVIMQGLECFLFGWQMGWWSSDALCLDDTLNQTIWADSPRLQKAIFPPPADLREGMVAAAQAFAGPPVRPWVPDLVGRECHREDAVLVMGITYADFFWRPTRGCKMELAYYRADQGPAEFQKVFLRDVVDGDWNYYERVALLLRGAEVELARCLITDLSRASVIQLQTHTKSGELRGFSKGICRKPKFQRYADANREWHKQRIDHGRFRVIVALGDDVRNKMKVWLRGWGWRLLSSEETDERMVFNFESGGRSIRLLHVPHPNSSTGAPADAIPALRHILRADRCSPSAFAPFQRVLRSSAHARKQSPEPAGVTWDRAWQEVFRPTSPLPAAVRLATHPEATALASQLTAGLTVRRVVAISNALYNPCRRRIARGGGPTAIEEAWNILLHRRDGPYEGPGKTWERTVAVLHPIPDWAAERIRTMDITALGGVSRGVIRIYRKLLIGRLDIHPAPSPSGRCHAGSVELLGF
jgi:hypothetical protein